ncbi:MAG TPA: radical SAM family heme chaperone HemW [Gemmatimonadales bacterium]
MHLYIHVPFCARRCSYCDFAIAVRRVVPGTDYLASVLREWQWRLSHPAWAHGPRVETIYFGGGTPSLLDPRAVAAILERIAGDRPVAPDAEITLEANPDDVTPAAARAWRSAGVNRVSLGVQSFDPAVLRWMHRTHTAGQVPAAVEALCAAGLPEISLDLIFGLPAALERLWVADLTAALALAPEHLSLYGLTVEQGTPLGRWTARGEVTPVDEDRYAAEFITAHEMLGAAGFEHYEVSNYARTGRRARHNSAYWRRAPFLGLGPSAHSGWDRHREWNLREWTAYHRALWQETSPVAGSELLEDDAVGLEEVYLGLRTQDGLEAERLDPATLARWVGEGWARSEGGRVRLTAEGWLRLDALVAAAGPARFPLVP